MNSMNLPGPREKLAGCVWLPRMIAKARLLLAGKLPAEYEAPFCNPNRGIDGVFVKFFGWSREGVLDTAAHDDEEVARRFLALPGATPARIDEWNALAPNLGRPGHPGEERFQWALKNIYPNLDPASVNCVFEAIETDEGLR